MSVPSSFEPADPRAFAWLVTQDDLDALPRVYRDDPLLAGDADSAPITAAVVPPDEDDEDRFAPELLDELRRLGDTFGPLGVAIAAASLTDAQALTAAIRDAHTGEGANVDRLVASIDDLRRRARAAETAHLRDAAEWDRRSAQGREQVDRLVASNDDLRRQLAVARATIRSDAEATEEQADALRSEVARLSGLLDEPAPQHRPHPGANAWPDDAVTVTYAELRRLIALHLDTLARTLGKLAPWDDCRRTAAAVRDGEVPLLLSEVLDR